MTQRFKLDRKEDIRSFYEDTFVLTNAEFAGDEPDTLVKQALVMVEGEHVDSAKRRHSFSADRVQELVENTNAFLENGGRVPWQRDHKKDQDSNIGDLEGLLELRIITPRDVPDPRLLKRLVGRVGAFATRLVAKGRDVVDQIKAGRIVTLSPGIDVSTNTIREISATPTPAIVGLRTFKRSHKSQVTSHNSDSLVTCDLPPVTCFALTFEEAELEQADISEFKQKYDELVDRFWNIILSVTQSSGEDLQGQDPIDLQYDAINGLAERLIKLLNLESAQEQVATINNQGNTGSAPVPQYSQSQQRDIPPGGQANMSAYTMADMAELMYGRGGTRAEFARRGRRRRRRKGGGVAGAVLGRTTSGRLARVAGLGAAAAGLRYGMPAGRSALGVYNASRTVGVGRMASLRAGGAAGLSIGRAGIERDVAGVRGAITGAYTGASRGARGAYVGARRAANRAGRSLRGARPAPAGPRNIPITGGGPVYTAPRNISIVDGGPTRIPIS